VNTSSFSCTPLSYVMFEGGAVCTKEEIDKFIHKYDPPPKKVEIAQKELTSEQEEELEGLMKIMDEDGVCVF